jgi:ribonucleoside-diphosphate reductase alpha chain
MQAVVNDGEWKTRAVTSGDVVDTYKARDMMRQIADSAYICGDPGMQYDTTVNRWHTSKNTAPINASNPCSEYMFLDDSACNLASLNLMKFDKGGKFDVESFRKAVDITITAQEIIVGFASYPTKKIEINSFDYRPLGLGYANLGALLMSQGMAYDSDLGRDCAAGNHCDHDREKPISSPRKSRRKWGPCAGYESNKKPFLEVMRMHRDAGA